MSFQQILDTVSQYDTITLFRHQHPDCDAAGSQAGFRQWINDNFPEKQVYLLGSERCTQRDFPSADQVDDDTIKKSLAIVLDTSNAERVDDSRFTLAAAVIKIDHHPDRTPFGTISYVDESAAATCEILTSLFRFSGRNISAATADYLYTGLLTDTLCFKTSNTTAKTLAAASYLAGFGVKIAELNRTLFDQSMTEFDFANYIRTHYQLMGDHLAYELISEDCQKEHHLTDSDARNFIDELGHVREFEVWCLFTQKTVNGKSLYDGSLRSKTVAVNGLAEQYSGGGHKNAAGIKDLDESKLKSLLQSLFLISSKNM